jgi:hypothetical protein
MRIEFEIFDIYIRVCYHERTPCAGCAGRVGSQVGIPIFIIKDIKELLISTSLAKSGDDEVGSADYFISG